MRPELLLRPVPIAANFTLGARALVTFSERVVPGQLDPNNWFLRWNNLWVHIPVADSFGFPASQVVRLFKGQTTVSVGPNVVSYAPPPFDVISFGTGNHALRFSNFPLNP